MYNLFRFLSAQSSEYCGYNQALTEIKSGFKSSHWIWYVFPQLKGLGHSYNSEFYGLNGLDEAKAYLADDVLSKRLIEISQVLYDLNANDITNVLGGIDSVKVRSCMTLFEIACEDKDSIFSKVLEKYYGGKRCKRTLAMI